MGAFGSVILATRVWVALCLGALGLMILLSVFGNAIAPRIWSSPEEMNRLGRILLPVFLALFLVLGFAVVPVAVDGLTTALERLWQPASHPLQERALSLLRAHQVHLVAGFWGLYVVGLLIAAPYAIREWARDPGLPWSAGAGPAQPAGAAGAMPPLDYQVRHARQILLLDTVVSAGRVRYSLLAVLKQDRPIVEPDAAGLLEADTRSFESLGYRPEPGQHVVMFFSEPDSTGRTLFELLLPAGDGTMRYPAYAVPPDPSIERVLTLEDLERMVAAQAAP